MLQLYMGVANNSSGNNRGISLETNAFSMQKDDKISTFLTLRKKILCFSFAGFFFWHIPKSKLFFKIR